MYCNLASTGHRAPQLHLACLKHQYWFTLMCGDNRPANKDKWFSTALVQARPARQYERWDVSYQTSSVLCKNHRCSCHMVEGRLTRIHGGMCSAGSLWGSTPSAGHCIGGSPSTCPAPSNARVKCSMVVSSFSRGCEACHCRTSAWYGAWHSATQQPLLGAPCDVGEHTSTHLGRSYLLRLVGCSARDV